MEGPRGLVYRPRPVHGAQNGMDGPNQSRVYRTSSSSSYVTYGSLFGVTTLRTMDNPMENPMDNSSHDMYSSTDLSQDTGDPRKGYWISPSAYLTDIVPSHGQIWSPPDMNGFAQGNHALAASLYQGDTYNPQTLYSPHTAASTSMARLSQVAGQPPLSMRPNQPMEGDFTPGTSSQMYFSPQSQSGRDPMHG